MSQTLLQVSNLSAGTEDKPILHNISLEVGAGETHVLMGPMAPASPHSAM